MARARKPVVVAIEDVDEEDDDEAEDEPRRPSELSELLHQLGGSSSISAKVKRVLREEDKGVRGVSAGYVGMIARGDVKPETLEEEIAKMAGGGGGEYDVQFLVNNQFQKGAGCRISVSGPARVVLPPGASEQAAVARTDPIVEELRAEVARMKAAEAAKAENDKFTNALAAALAPVTAKLAALESRAVAPAAPSFAERFMESRLTGEPKADPQVTALLATVKDLQDSIKRQNEVAAQKVNDDLRAELAAIKQTLATAAEAKPAEDPNSIRSILAPLIDAAAANKILHKLSKDEEELEDDEEEGFPDLYALGRKLIGPVVRKKMESLAKPIMRGLADAQRAPSLPEPPETPGAPPEPVIVPPTFQAWAVYLLTGNDAMARVQDVEWVRASLAAYRSNVEACAKITTTPGLLEFVRATLGEAAEGEVKAGLAKDPKNEAAALTLVAVLKQTIARADAAPAPKPVQAVVEPKREAEEDDGE